MHMHIPHPHTSQISPQTDPVNLHATTNIMKFLNVRQKFETQLDCLVG